MLDDNLSGVAERFSVPVIEILDVREEFSFVGFSDDCRWAALGLLGFEERACQLLNIMSVNSNRVETESIETFAVNFDIVLKRSRLRLTQAIDVENDAQVVEFVVAGEVQRLPDGTFSRFTVTDDDISSRNGWEIVDKTLKIKIKNVR